MANVKFSQLPNLGNITATTTVPVVDAFTNYTVTMSNLQAYVNSTAGNITAGNIAVTGQVTAVGNITGNYILGNGSLLTGLPATYGNANVAAYLPTYTGNLNPGNLAVSTAATFNGVVLSNIGTPVAGSDAVTKSYVDGELSSSGFQITDGITTETISNGSELLITGTVNEISVGVSAPDTVTIGLPDNVTVTGNVTATYFLGNGSQLTGITGTSSNSFATISANGTNIVADSSSDTLTLTPGTNIAITGNATSDTITIALSGTVANATYATTAGTATTATTATSATTATTAGTVTSASQPSITSVGTLTSLNISGGPLSVTYNAGAGAMSVINTDSSGAGLRIQAGGGGGGRPLDIYSSANTAIANISSGGVLSSQGANIAGQFNVVYTAGAQTANIVNTDSSGAGLRIQAGVGTGLILDLNNASGTAVANINASGNLTTSGTATITGNITGGNLVTSNTVSAGTASISTLTNTGNLRVTPRTIATSSTTGTAGDVAWDADYIYVCTATNTWKRVALTTF